MLACASTVPTSDTYLRHRLVLIDAELLAQLRADLLAELPLFGVGMLMVVELVLGVLRPCSAAS